MKEVESAVFPSVQEGIEPVPKHCHLSSGSIAGIIIGIVIFACHIVLGIHLVRIRFLNKNIN